jgi:hypothetical protein
MISRKLVFLLSVNLLLIVNVAAAQSPSATPTPTPTRGGVMGGNVRLAEPPLDTQAMIKETQQVEISREKMAMFWWVPPDFWTTLWQVRIGGGERAPKELAAFKNYHLFFIALRQGSESGPGSSWTDEETIRTHVLLRDQYGNAYKPFNEIPKDLRPLLEKVKSKISQSDAELRIVMFPVRDAAGNLFADPRKSSELRLEVANLMGPPIKTYFWRFPMTSLSPAKYCPMGKEKVEASWKFCPWHGIPLSQETIPPTGK